MAFLTDYYQGLAGAEDLDYRTRNELIDRGEALRYADASGLMDRDIATIRERGGVMHIPKQGGGYTTIRPDAGVQPGGWKTISGQEALARWGSGQRPVEDPGGVIPSLQRQNYAAAQTQALKVADYLAQFLPPDRVADETFKMTGVRIGAETTPNLLKRKAEELGLRKTEAETIAQRAKARETEEDIKAKQQKAKEAPVEEFATMESAVQNLNRLADQAAVVRDSPALWRAAGPIAGKYIPTATHGAADVEAGLFALKAQVGFAALTALREASKTGGGLGNVSDADIKNLQNSIAALEITQSPEQLRKSLDSVIHYTDQVRAKMERGYTGKYGKMPVDLPRPAHEQLPKAARQSLQEGVPVQFGNGQVWMLRGGIPQRIK